MVVEGRTDRARLFDVTWDGRNAFNLPLQAGEDGRATVRLTVPATTLGQHRILVTSDAYSLSLDGERWQWTLLRSPKMAWGGGEPVVYSGRDQYTDQGQHTFDFVLFVGPRLDETLLHTAARQQMQPPIVFDRYEGMDRPPWGNNPPRALWLGAVERAMADGRMGHLLENQDVDAVRPLFERPDRGQEQ